MPSWKKESPTSEIITGFRKEEIRGQKLDGRIIIQSNF